MTNSSAHNTRLPDVYIVGTQKGGTGWLYKNLSSHPSVHRGVKEVCYWHNNAFQNTLVSQDHGRLYGPASLAAYKRQFDGSGPDQLLIDASPNYMTCPWVAAAIRKFKPDAKIIFLLREPVSRAYSNYQMYLRLNMEANHSPQALIEDMERLKAQPWFPEYLDPTSDGTRFFKHWEVSPDMTKWANYPAYTIRGLYAPQITRWLRHFPTKNMMFLVSEVARVTPDKVFASVQDFLGLAQIPLQVPIFKNHRAAYPPIDHEVKGELAQFYEPYNQELFRMMNLKKPLWTA